jgi:hypothetical protein
MASSPRERSTSAKRVVSDNLSELLDRPAFRSLTLRWIARRFEVSPSTISNHLRGLAMPSLRQLGLWSNLLRVDIHQITTPRLAVFGSPDGRTLLKAVIDCDDEKRFRQMTSSDELSAADVDVYGLIRRAILDGRNMGLVNIGWTENRSLSSELHHTFGLGNIEVQVIDTEQGNTSHIYDATAEAIWNHSTKLFRLRGSKSERSDELITIRGAIGSGSSVGAVMDRVIENIAKECRSAQNESGHPFTFDFHPMASSIHTQRPADNIPSVFLHAAIDKWKLSEVKERVYPTPDHIYKLKSPVSWFFRNIDFVVTSVAATSDKHSMLTQHLQQLRFPNHDAVGEVQFRPFSSSGFLRPSDRRLPKTLLPIGELARFSKYRPKGRPAPLVVMTVGPCGLCGHLKDAAIAPMLRNPFSH